jgi:NAD(P)-dependent dehydrogenase (short-subunit alcohol dehydrogenase family)
MPETRLQGQTALVTGAAQRVGREIALTLAREGVNIVIHYRSSKDEAESLERELKETGVNSWLVQADFERSLEYENLINRTVEVAGSLNMLVNNASVFPSDTLKSLSRQNLVQSLELNAWAPFSLCRQFATAVGRGKIVNLLDTRVNSYDWTHVSYILSKHVLSEFTRMMAVEYAPDITVNGVSPGLILPPPGKDRSYLKRLEHTVPLKRHGNPNDVAQAVLFLLKSDFLTGTIIAVDGGRHLMEYALGPHPD